MRILVFTEGTILMHRSGQGLAREERARQSKAREAPVYDYRNYVPIGDAVGKLRAFKEQGAELFYLTSRTAPDEIEDIALVLREFSFPDRANLLHRLFGERYGDVAERLMPDVLVEDECESIGGEPQMTYPQIGDALRGGIRSIVVKEFGGIDHLPERLAGLGTYARPAAI